MALVRAERLRFSYPDAPRPALDGVSVELEAGEIVAVLGPSGSGKSTLLRAFSGLVPHFHGGRFEGRVEVAGLDTRTARPSDLAGHVGTLFQDPEDQVVLSRVDREVQFGLENLGVPPGEIAARTRGALAAVGAEHLMSRLVSTLSGGELQRVCLASTLALRPALLLLDEPTSQLDPAAAAALLELVSGLGCAVVVSEQRPARPLAVADRVLFLERGRILLDAPRDAAYAAIYEVVGYPTWWPEVKMVRKLDADRFWLRTRSILPYNLSFSLDRQIADPAAGVLEAMLRGDLEGRIRWTIEPAAGGCRITFDEDVVTNKTALHALAPIARPAFVANHGLMMAHGQAGLRPFLSGYAFGREPGEAPGSR